MCGILFSTASTISAENFYKALDIMVYRGPDASGVLKCEHFLMGQRRLAIIDLHQRSNQPLLSEDGQYAIIFNGEIYNYKELIKRYSLETRTGSDTEVLLQLFIRFGPRMLHDLNGMFSFVILNLQTHEWFVARDRLGVKPLYIANYHDGFLISSEPRPIIELVGTASFDDIGLRQYRKLRTFFNGATIWKGIQQFPAGHYMSERDKSNPVCWWELNSDHQEPPGDDELRALIEDAVRIRMVADVEVGSYLSGGLDSTIVAALAAQPHTWTVGFKDENEFPWARISAASVKSVHHEVEIGLSEFVKTAAEMVTIRREPLSVPNEVLIFAMTSKASKLNKVILSGEGADELFYGYDRIFRWAATNKWDLKTFASLYAYGSGDDLEIVEYAIEPFMHLKNALDIVAAFFQKRHLHGLLRRLDSASMLCGVEAREPFVDYRLVERMAGVPFAWKMANGIVKAPLKRIFSDILPPEIIERPKVGFPVPLDKIPFPVVCGDDNSNLMDRWFEFNLSVLSGSASIQENLKCGSSF